MRNYLLEIGTENLPVEFQSSAELQLSELLASRLKEERLDFKVIKTFSTPRRLALIINDLAHQQTDDVKVIKGPPANVGFKDGSPTPAVEGFARKFNLNVDQLKIEKYDNTEYIIANVEEKGRDSKEILQQIIPEIILNLKGSYFMRWEDLDVRFSRPIRWITSVIESESLPVNVANVTSTPNSYGHRFLSPGIVELTSPEEYQDKLREAFVIVDPDERRSTILKQLEAIASGVGGIIIPNEKLLDIVNNLVEWPVASLGEFDRSYLNIPHEVITTVMAVHQKYFPIYDIERKTLLNYFICVNNRNGSNVDNIIKGNQRVLKARLEDATFYYNEDNKTTLAAKVELLKGITFQKGLGTMHQKMERIKALSAEISHQLNISESQKENVLRTAELCKADLITTMVREFTDLEGIIGRVYALNSGEHPEVAWGISEHYLPRSADDCLPDSLPGKIVAIADKIDTIVSVFSIGKSPTGSADPLGLRRAALGLILISLKRNLNVNISALIQKAYELLGDIKRNEADKVIPQVRDFMIQRLRIYLNEHNYRYDAVEAVLNTKDPLANLLDLTSRLTLINSLVKEPDYSSFHESANRLPRILKGAEYQYNLDTSLFAHNSEIELNNALDLIQPENLTYNEMIIKLKELTPTIEKFFDDVLVMDKDDKIRNNRLSLVFKADQKYKTLADFSKIVN